MQGAEDQPKHPLQVSPTGQQVVIETELEVLYLGALLLLVDCICCLIAAYRRAPVLELSLVAALPARLLLC